MNDFRQRLMALKEENEQNRIEITKIKERLKNYQEQRQELLSDLPENLDEQIDEHRNEIETRLKKAEEILNVSMSFESTIEEDV